MIFSQTLSSSVMNATTEIIGDTIGGNLYTQNAGTNNATSIILGNGTGSGTYNLSGTGTVSAAAILVGSVGGGSLNQSGGSISVSSRLSVGGTSAGGGGFYSMAGGNLSLSGSAYLSIDTVPSGSMAQSAGTVNFTGTGGLYVENSTVVGSTNTYTLTGTGAITNASYEYIGEFGTGGSLFTQNGGNNTLGANGSLTIGDSNAGAYALTAGVLAANTQYVGYLSQGTVTQSGGNSTIGTTVFVGYSSGVSGSYALSNGSLNATTANVGYNGIGTFHQSGGTFTLTNLILAEAANASANFTLDASSGPSTLAVAGTELVGDFGTATLTQSGGNHTIAGGLIVANNAGCNAQFSLNAGNLTVGTVAVSAQVLIGNGGTGTLLQTGGNLSIPGANGYLGLGTYDSNNIAAGTYTMTGGNLTVAIIEMGTYFTIVNNAFVQSGGNVSVTSLQIATSSAETSHYVLSNQTSAASLNAASETLGYSGTAIFTQSGGSNIVSANLTLALSTGSVATYTLSNGSLAAGSLTIANFGSANLTQTGGSPLSLAAW